MAGKEGFKRGGMLEKAETVQQDAGQADAEHVGCITAGRQDRRDAGVEG